MNRKIGSSVCNFLSAIVLFQEALVRIVSINNNKYVPDQVPYLLKFVQLSSQSSISQLKNKQTGLNGEYDYKKQNGLEFDVILTCCLRIFP